MIIKYHMWAFVIGFILDLILGDPQGWWHPMILIGNLISTVEKWIRSRFPKSEKGEFYGGICLVCVVLVCATVVPFFICVLAYQINWKLGILVQGIMCYYLLATKCLKTESMKVQQALETEGIEAGRYAVSMIVGRDTSELTTEGVVKAAVETIAENTSDGVIAPMFYMAIGGPVLGFFYKAINTMDSMVGYKNEKYLYFGRAAAKLDDAANFIPARLTALFMIFGAYLGGFSGSDAWRIFLRDRKKHASPNSAQTESVMAGALGVQLAGDACYFGKLYKKQTIGDGKRPIEISDIKKANQLLYRTAWIGFFCMQVVGALIWM